MRFAFYKNHIVEVQKSSVSYGVHSEVGQLRKVIVCSPGLAHTRLTPTNCDERSNITY